MISNSLTVTFEHNAPRITPSFFRRASWCAMIKTIIKKCLTPYFVLRHFFYERQRRRFLYNNSSAYITLSAGFHPMMQRLVGQGKLNRLYALPNPVVDVGDVCFTEKKKQILFVGSVIPVKGCDRLLSVWRMLATKYSDWEFVIVGDGSERSWCENYVKQHQIPRVRFEGFQKDPSPYFKEAALFVMASDFEGWGLVLTEAMSHQCVPVVTDSYATCRELVEDGVSGFVVPHFNKKKFANALDKLMCDENLRVSMSQNAAMQMKKYSLPKVVAMWDDLFRNKLQLRKEKLNILFYQHQYPAFGGIETVTTILAHAFSGNGHNVKIVSFLHKDGTDQLEQLPSKDIWISLPSQNIDAQENYTALKSVVDIFSPDVVIFQDSYAPIEKLLFSVVRGGEL